MSATWSTDFMKDRWKHTRQNKNVKVNLQLHVVSIKKGSVIIHGHHHQIMTHLHKHAPSNERTDMNHNHIWKAGKINNNVNERDIIVLIDASETYRTKLSSQIFSFINVSWKHGHIPTDKQKGRYDYTNNHDIIPLNTKMKAKIVPQL